MAIPLRPAWDVTHPFAQHLLAADTTPARPPAAVSVVRPAVAAWQGLCASPPVCLTDGPQRQCSASDSSVTERSRGRCHRHAPPGQNSSGLSVVSGVHWGSRTLEGGLLCHVSDCLKQGTLS